MDNSPSHNRFFISPLVQKQDEIHTMLANMETFRKSLGEPDQDLVSILISFAGAHSSESHLLPHLTPFEFVLLAIVIEQQRELINLKKTPPEPVNGFNHPPFP